MIESMRFNGGEGSIEYICLRVNFGTSSKQKNSSKKYHAFLHKNVKYEIYSTHTHTHTHTQSMHPYLSYWWCGRRSSKWLRGWGRLGRVRSSRLLLCTVSTTPCGAIGVLVARSHPSSSSSPSSCSTWVRCLLASGGIRRVARNGTGTSRVSSITGLAISSCRGRGPSGYSRSVTAGGVASRGIGR